MPYSALKYFATLFPTKTKSYWYRYRKPTSLGPEKRYQFFVHLSCVAPAFLLSYWLYLIVHLHVD